MQICLWIRHIILMMWVLYSYSTLFPSVVFISRNPILVLDTALDPITMVLVMRWYLHYYWYLVGTVHHVQPWNL
jgi:hypothetical protein